MSRIMCVSISDGRNIESDAAGQKTGDRETGEEKLRFGNFSVSLAVKDIKASNTFYEKLDFERIHGNMQQSWVIMQNGTTTIGLFQGCLTKTF